MYQVCTVCQELSDAFTQSSQQSVEEVLYYLYFTDEDAWGTERLSYLSGVTQLLSGKFGF